MYSWVCHGGTTDPISCMSVQVLCGSPLYLTQIGLLGDSARGTAPGCTLIRTCNQVKSSVGADPWAPGIIRWWQSSSFFSTIPFIFTSLSPRATNLPSFHGDATSSSRCDRPHCKVPSKHLPFGERETLTVPDSQTGVSRFRATSSCSHTLHSLQK